MSVKIFVDLKSQPCRALAIFLKNSDIPFELKHISLLEGEQNKPEYLSDFPRHKVPSMSDGDYHLGETVAIFRYLTSKFAGKFPDHWYPADLKARGRVDEYMAYHHVGVREKCIAVFVSEFLMPVVFGKHIPEEQWKPKLDDLSEALDQFESFYLKEDYICGDEISFADVLAVSEFVEFIVNGRNITEGRPRLEAYIDRVKNRLNPIFDEVQTTLYEWRDWYKSTQKK